MQQAWSFSIHAWTMSGPASPSVHIRVSIGGNIGSGGWGGSESKNWKFE